MGKARGARKEGGRNLAIERILTHGPYAKKSSNLHVKNGSDWPIYGPPHGRKLMQHVHPNWKKRAADLLSNFRADKSEVTLAEEPDVSTLYKFQYASYY